MFLLPSIFLSYLVTSAPLVQSDPIAAAQERAIHYLLENQHSDGSWTLPGNERFCHAGAAFLGFALLRAGLPSHHAAIWKVDRLLQHVPPRSTYDAAVRVQFLDALRPSDFRARMQRCVEHLAPPKRDYYGYGYTPTLPYGDLSNHQFALLAWDILDEHGFGPRKEVWKDWAELLLRQQTEDGGWGYLLSESSSPTMRLAGLACLAACRRGLIRAEEGNKLLRKIDTALDHGFASAGAAWFLEAERKKAPLRRWIHYAGATLERAASLASRTQVGEHDWFEEVSQFLLETQRANGSWSSAQGEPTLNTGLALATLSRSTASTGSTSATGPSWQLRWRSDPEAPIQLVASGSSPCTAFVSSIHPGKIGAGAQVVEVRWQCNGTDLGSGTGDRGTIQFELPGNGKHSLTAQIHLRFPGSNGQADDEEVFDAILKIEAQGLIDARVLAAAAWLEHLAVSLDSAEAELSVSSHRGGKAGKGWGHDGCEATSWRWKPEDQEPSWSIELEDSVRCLGIRLVPHLESVAQDRESSQTIELRLRVNGKRMRVDAVNFAAGVYHSFSRPTRVRALHVGFVDPEAAKAAGWVGFREIQLIAH
jgi:Prenyltransferase and squalene oxidase repeat